MRDYYKAYDERYRTVHGLGLSWMEDRPSPIVEETMKELGISKEARVLEVGCGEGRDASYLLDRGYNIRGIDVSKEAIEYCKNKGWPRSFYEFDILRGSLIEDYSFIYSIGVIHMLVLDEDRLAYLKAIYRQLEEAGHALITSMGDGFMTSSSDIGRAFNQVERTHGASGRKLRLTETSCRVVDWETFEGELDQAGFELVEKGITKTVPGFNMMMYALIKRAA